MIDYCLGFAFTRDYSGHPRVLLIRKTHPEWQAGKLNGVGGKVEPSDFTTHRAMVREFKEETGLDSIPAGWTKFAILDFPGCRVHCFVTWYEWKVFKHAKSVTEETLESYQMDLEFIQKMRDQKAIPNLLWLVSMAQAAWWMDSPLLVIREANKEDKFSREGLSLGFISDLSSAST